MKKKSSGSTVKRIDSEFRASFFGRLRVKAVVTVGSILSLGFAAPWLICYKQKYMTAHTYINGKKQYFDGKGSQLFGHYMLWLLLSVVTFGVFSYAMPAKIHAFIIEHTHFEGETPRGESRFEGSAFTYMGISLLSLLISSATFGIGSFWTTCWRERYLVSHTVIDGKKLCFTGKGIQLFARGIVWYLLSVITLGIYSFFLAYKQHKWLVYHTELEAAVKELKRYDPSILKEKALQEKKQTKEWKRASLLFKVALIVGGTTATLSVAYFIVCRLDPAISPLSLILIYGVILATLTQAGLLFIAGIFADKANRQTLNTVTVVWAILLCIWSVSLINTAISATSELINSNEPPSQITESTEVGNIIQKSE